MPQHPPEFDGFFAALGHRALAFPCCAACGRFHWYPMKRCPHCGSGDIGWQEVGGEGEVFSWTAVRHAFDPAYADRLPYVVALVEFADAPGVRLVTNVAADPAALRIGMKVRPAFAAGDAPDAVAFRPVDG